MSNTKFHGEVNIVILRDSSKDEYVGFCYDFAIVKYGDDLTELKKDLIEAAQGYVESINENELSDELLNRSSELPKEFRAIYQLITDRIEKKDTRHKRRGFSMPKSYINAVNIGDAFLVPACV